MRNITPHYLFINKHFHAIFIIINKPIITSLNRLNVSDLITKSKKKYDELFDKYDAMVKEYDLLKLLKSNSTVIKKKPTQNTFLKTNIYKKVCYN